jgi:antitoxin ParD1/3/4
VPTSVSLNPYFESFIRDQVESGRFNNVSEVVRAGLRLLEEQQKQVEALRSAVLDGISWEKAVPAEDVFDRLEARFENMAQEQERGPE